MGRNKVKPEQASKVLMRMLTLRSFGEGRTCGEAIDTRTHAIRRGSGHGTSVGWFVSALPPITGIVRPHAQVRSVPIASLRADKGRQQKAARRRLSISILIY